MTYEITVPFWRPTTLNELLDVSPFRRSRLKRVDRDLVDAYARLADVPRAAGRRRVSLRITIPTGQRRWDGDALWKSLLDAMTASGLIRDDGPRWCELGPVEYVRTPDREDERRRRTVRRPDVLSTTIVLEDVEDA